MLATVRAAGGISVAMGNAMPKTLAAAGWVGPTNDEDGVAKAVRYFVLGEEQYAGCFTRNGGGKL